MDFFGINGALRIKLYLSDKIQSTKTKIKGDKIKMNSNEEKVCTNCGDIKNVNDGITCDVKNCVYHAGDCYCTANKIAVGPSFASASSDTACVTFKQKEI